MTQELEARRHQHGDFLYFGMYTDAGNEAVFQALAEISDRCRSGELKRTDLLLALTTMDNALCAQGHTEVTDTEVRIHASRYVNEFINRPNSWALMDIDYITYYA